MCYPIVPRLGAFNAPNNFISHSHESFLHKMIEYIDGTLFDWGRAIDYAAQWIDYSKCSPEVKKGADRVKGAVDRVNVVFSGCATASAVHNLLDADDNSVGVAEVTAVLSSGAEFLDRLEGLGAIKLAEGASPALAGIGAVADVVGGSYDCAGVLWDKHVKASDSEGLAQAKKSIGYKALKIAETVAYVALAALSGLATYCVAFAVAAPILPFALLVVGTTAFSIKMMRRFYEGLADNGQLQVDPNLMARAAATAARDPEARENIRVTRLTTQVTNLTAEVARLKGENHELNHENVGLKGLVTGLREGLEASSRMSIQLFNRGDVLTLDGNEGRGTADAASEISDEHAEASL